MPQPEAVYVNNIAAGSNPAYYVPGARASGTSTLNSKRSAPGKAGRVSYQVTAAADAGQSLVGTLTVEFSNSTMDEFARGAEKWTTVPSTSIRAAIPAVNLASGASTTFFVELVDAGAFTYRLKFAQASGLGYVYANVLAS